MSILKSLASSPWLYSRPALGYDTSIFELAGEVRPGLHPWSLNDLKATLAERAAWEKARRELHVYYYRINHLMAFPLPLAHRPVELPAGIPQLKWYPWLIWLAWVLEERWTTLHSAWRYLDDKEAGRLLQTELAELDGWYSFRNWNNEVGLPTGHLAGCLARCLKNGQEWDADLWQRAFGAAMRMVERDFWPWFQETWAEERELTPHDIHNIPVIALVRGAQLARFVDSPQMEPHQIEAMEARARDALRAWWRFRRDAAAPHTEGVSYDGFLMDSFTDWLDGLPDRAALLAEGRDAFPTMACAGGSFAETRPCAGRPRRSMRRPFSGMSNRSPFFAPVRSLSWQVWSFTGLTLSFRSFGDVSFSAGSTRFATVTHRLTSHRRESHDQQDLVSAHPTPSGDARGAHCRAGRMWQAHRAAAGPALGE